MLPNNVTHSNRYINQTIENHSSEKEKNETHFNSESLLPNNDTHSNRYTNQTIENTQNIMSENIVNHKYDENHFNHSKII